MTDLRNKVVFQRKLLFWLTFINENLFACDVNGIFSKLRNAPMLNARLLIFTYFRTHREKLKIDSTNIDLLIDHLSLQKVDLSTLVRYQRFISFHNGFDGQLS